MLKQLIDRLGIEDSKENMGRLIQAVQSTSPSDGDIAHLAKHLANSGYRAGRMDASEAADVSSSGGPSSLSTLLCPLYLRALGFKVPKVGVPGRPAGGLDVLAQIGGYRVDLDADAARACLKHAGYVHVSAGNDLAPLDSLLFAFRKRVGALAVPALTIASLLSKKLAVGLSRVGLDIRVAPHGNFGATWAEARGNAQQFNRVARLLGIEAVCFLTEARVQYQPYLGRGEALLAVYEILSDVAAPSLRRHDDLCFAMALGTAGIDGRVRPSHKNLEHIFRQNVEIQGGTLEEFGRRVSEVRTAHTNTIEAETDGFVAIDLQRLRTVLVKAQRAVPDGLRFPDPCGIILQRRAGEYVRRGEALATVRAEAICWDEWRTSFKNGFWVSPEIPHLPQFEMVVE